MYPIAGGVSRAGGRRRGRRDVANDDPGGLRTRLPGLVASWRGGARVADVRPLVGGKSSLTYRVDLEAGAPIVVKMAPPGIPPTRNRDVLRQARVQDAIACTGRAPVAPVCFTDPGAPPDVPPLYAMAFLAGESFEPLLDACEELPPAATIRARQLAAARALAGVHSIDPVAVGLDGEPEVTLAEEVERWLRIFDTVADDLREGYRAPADALLATLPAPVLPTVVHGEYRLGNLLALDDEIVAIIDWELWTREDPRVDLSWFLSYLDADEQPSAIRPTPPGMPSRAEVLAAYEDVAGAPVAALGWFDAHARFKMAAIAALVNKHNRRREHPDPEQEALVPVIGRLLTEAQRLLDRSPTWR
jgi:aminoglycoside phosphotransferase (APT) family kinase protein